MENPEIETHRARITVSEDGELMGFRIECETCGEILIGPFPLAHLMTLRDVAKDMVERVGLEQVTEGKGLKFVGRESAPPGTGSIEEAMRAKGVGRLQKLWQGMRKH